MIFEPLMGKSYTASGIVDRLRLNQGGGTKDASIPSASVDDFIVFGAQLRKRGLLGTYTDTSIAYLAQKQGLPVMSFDKYFTKLAAAEIIDKV